MWMKHFSKLDCLKKKKKVELELPRLEFQVHKNYSQGTRVS